MPNYAYRVIVIHAKLMVETQYLASLQNNNKENLYFLGLLILTHSQDMFPHTKKTLSKIAPLALK